LNAFPSDRAAGCSPAPAAPPGPAVTAPVNAGPGTQTMRLLSLGAGVQSTTLLLMSVYGDLPKLDAAIFADTGWEPKRVYEHLAKVTAEAERGGSAGDQG
jgi:hypothetical protein